ncbi:hypothetical protein B0H12DRAFT_351750 [Mycena haematopus]|nr:hypothetical protein B0H12DRAFT_351750 [Mycena haematopus]
MSSTEQSPASKVTPTPLTALPTLQIIPPFTYTPVVIPTSKSVPAFAALPAASELQLASIVRSADVPRSASALDANSVKRGVLPFDLEPVDAFDDDPDPDEEAFLTGPLTGPQDAPSLAPAALDKGKQKAPGPAAPSQNPAASGSSRAPHWFHRDAGFYPDEVRAKDKSYTVKDHKIAREHINGLLDAGTKLYDRVDRVRSDMRDLAGFIPAIQDQMAEIAKARPGSTSDELMDDLWYSHRQHGENLRQHGVGINDISDRLMPSVFKRLDDLQGTVKKLSSMVDTLALAAMGAPRPAAAPAPAVAMSAPAATAPAVIAPAPAPVNFPPNAPHPLHPSLLHPDEIPAIMAHFLAESGKRAREEEIEAAVRSVRARTAAGLAPDPFVHTAPPPLAPPQYAPAAYHAPPPLAPAPLRLPPAEPARPPPAEPARPPPAAGTARPHPPRTQRHLAAAPAQRGPAGQRGPDPACEVVFGPVAWNRNERGIATNVHADITNLIRDIIPDALNYDFTTRRFRPSGEQRAREDYTVVAFRTPAIAAWIVEAWDAQPRGDFAYIYAFPFDPNA